MNYVYSRKISTSKCKPYFDFYSRAIHARLVLYKKYITMFFKIYKIKGWEHVSAVLKLRDSGNKSALIFFNLSDL